MSPDFLDLLRALLGADVPASPYTMFFQRGAGGFEQVVQFGELPGIRVAVVA